MKYEKSTTPACKDILNKKIIICGEFLALFGCFSVTYKVSKKAALALVYKPQWKFFSGFNVWG